MYSSTHSRTMGRPTRAVARQSMSRTLSPSRYSRLPRYSNDSPMCDAIATPPGWYRRLVGRLAGPGA